MNKKQIIVTAIMVILVSIIVLTAPKYYSCTTAATGLKIMKSNSDLALPSIDWDIVLQRSIPVILIGSFLIIVLKDKQKI